MKAILVIDEMPENCGKCRLADFGECRGTKSYIHMPIKGRPKECPLKSLPEKKEHEEEVDYDYGYIDGWNDCISTMSGEEENNGLRPLKDDSHEYYGCPSCLHIVSSVQNYCENCGQKLDWRNVGDIG